MNENISGHEKNITDKIEKALENNEFKPFYQP